MSIRHQKPANLLQKFGIICTSACKLVTSI